MALFIRKTDSLLFYNYEDIILSLQKAKIEKFGSKARLSEPVLSTVVTVVTHPRLLAGVMLYWRPALSYLIWSPLGSHGDESIVLLV